MGGKTSTTTSKVQIPPEVLARYNAVNAQAAQTAKTPFQIYSTSPDAFVAPLNNQQRGAISNINATANSHMPAVMGGEALTLAGAGSALPSNLDGSSINKYLSPYLGTVLNSQSALINQNNQQQQSGQMGQAIASGAFGGDRAGIAAANLNQQQNLAAANIYANTLNTGYNTALNTAQGQQELDLAARQADLARLQGAGGQLANIGMAGQQAGLAGAEAQLNAGTLGQQTSQAGLSALYNQFQQQKAYPFQVAQFLADIAMGTGSLSGSTTTSTQPAPFFSDRRLKYDVRKIGDADNGLPIYSYKYKNDPHGQTHVGFMADEVEEKRPEAVGVAGGYKTVDYDRASRASGGGIGGGGFYGIENGGGYVPEARLPVGQLMLPQIPQGQPEGGLLSELGSVAGAGTNIADGFESLKGLAVGKKGDTPEDGTKGILGYGGKWDPKNGFFSGMSSGGVAGSDLLDNDVKNVVDPKGYVPESSNKSHDLADLQSKVSVHPGQSTMGQIGETASTLGSLAKLAMMLMKDGGVARTGLAGGGVPDIATNQIDNLFENEPHILRRNMGVPPSYLSEALDTPPPTPPKTDGGVGLVTAELPPPRAGHGTGSATVELPPPRVASEGVSPAPGAPARPMSAPPARPPVSPAVATGLAPVASPMPHARPDAPAPAPEPKSVGVAPPMLDPPVVNPKPTNVSGSGFQSAVQFTMNAEGGLNPSDANGTPSNYGINQAAHPNIDVTKITPDQAKSIYKTEYWDPVGGDALYAKNPQLATMVFDTAVMAGVGRARALLEQSGGDPQKFMVLRTRFLNGLIEKDPAKYGKYAKSWNNRNNGLAEGYDIQTHVSTMGGSGGTSGYGDSGLAGGDGPHGMGNFWQGLKQGNANSILPFLVGLGDMASSNSRYLGSAILQGIGGGAKAYMDRQKEMANLSNVQAHTGLVGEQAAQTESVTQGILTDNLQKATTTIAGIGPAVYVLDPTTKSVVIMPLSRYQSLPEGQKPQLINSSAYIAGTPPTGGTTDGGVPPSVPVADSSPTLGTDSAPVAGGATIATPAPAPVTPLEGVVFGGVGTAAAMADNIGAHGEDTAVSAANAQKTYTDITGQADAARRQEPYTKELATSIGATATGVGAAGSGFSAFSSADSIFNTIARSLGLAGPGDSYFGDVATAGQIAQKIQTMQAAMTSQGFGQDSVNALSQFANATPNLTMTPLASATLTAQILADQQRLIDRGAYASNYRGANPTTSFTGFDQAFAQENPQEKYIRERTELQYLMLGLSPKGEPLPGKNAFPIIASGKAPIEQAREALKAMGYSPDLVRYFYGGSN